MLKHLLSTEWILGVLFCVFVLFIAVVVYQESVKQQAHRDIQRNEAIVEEMPQPKTGSQPVESVHYHSDGTYHVGSHGTTSGTPDFSTDNEKERTQAQRDAEEKYFEALSVCIDAKIDLSNIKLDVAMLVSKIQRRASETRKRELISFAVNIAISRAFAIIGSEDTVDIGLASLEEKGLPATLQELLHDLYHLETKLITQTEALQAQAVNVNSTLDAWKAVEPDVTYDDPLDEMYIDVERDHPDYARTLSDPPAYPSETAETIACPACGVQVRPPHLVKRARLVYGLQLGMETHKVYRGHEVLCSDMRSSTGEVCDGRYYSCLSPYSSASVVCPHDTDHRSAIGE